MKHPQKLSLTICLVKELLSHFRVEETSFSYLGTVTFNQVTIQLIRKAESPHHNLLITQQNKFGLEVEGINFNFTLKLSIVITSHA